MKKLNEIHIDDLKNFTIDKDIIKYAKKTNQPIFKLSTRKTGASSKTSDLVEIEIAMRKCRRVGFFKK